MIALRYDMLCCSTSFFFIGVQYLAVDIPEPECLRLLAISIVDMEVLYYLNGKRCKDHEIPLRGELQR